MSRLTLVAMLSWAVWTPVPTAQAEDAAEAALAPLQGRWLVTSVVRGGQKEAILAEATLLFQNDRVSLNGNEAAKVVVDDSTQPKLIDFLVQGDAQQTVEGIYRLDGDELQICIRVEDVKNRPTEFETAEDANLILIKLAKKPANE